MEVFSIGPEEYAAELDRYAPHVYNRVAFNLHNRSKADNVRFLVLADSKVRFGLIAGERDGRLLSPFSAPFGGLTWRGRQSVEHLFAASEALKRYASTTGKSISITLPPAIYSPSLVAGQTAAFGKVGRVNQPDLNYHVSLDFQPGNAVSKLTGPSSRNSRKVAMRRPHRLLIAGPADMEMARRVYEVIRANHEALNHPLRMSFEEVMATAPITGSHFLLMQQAGEDVAAAVINNSAPEIAQIIYWGDHPHARIHHPMNLFATEVMEWARTQGFRLMDIGPSSEHGVPSPGLCRFKESIGCELSLKHTIVIEPESGSGC